MQSKKISKLLVFLAGAQFLLYAAFLGPASKSMILCVGSEGHIALEYGEAKLSSENTNCCASCIDHQEVEVDKCEVEIQHYNDCGDCLDISLAKNLSLYSGKQSASLHIDSAFKPIPLQIPIFENSENSDGFIQIDKLLSLLPKPSTEKIRTIVLLI